MEKIKIDREKYPVMSEEVHKGGRDRSRVCDRCHGSGKQGMILKRTCTKCNGSGHPWRCDAPIYRI
jgi:DnaJ-class molecular chaperone